jgi:hypothetical protein
MKFGGGGVIMWRIRGAEILRTPVTGSQGMLWTCNLLYTPRIIKVLSVVFL